MSASNYLICTKIYLSLRAMDWYSFRNARTDINNERTGECCGRQWPCTVLTEHAPMSTVIIRKFVVIFTPSKAGNLNQSTIGNHDCRLSVIFDVRRNQNAISKTFLKMFSSFLLSFVRSFLRSFLRSSLPYSLTRSLFER